MWLLGGPMSAPSKMVLMGPLSGSTVSHFFVKESSSLAFVLSLSWSVGSVLRHEHGPAPCMSGGTLACCHIVAMLLCRFDVELVCSSSCICSISILFHSFTALQCPVLKVYSNVCCSLTIT